MYRLLCVYAVATLTLAATVPDNPCPHVFQYQNVNNHVSGLIRVPYDGKTKTLVLTANASLEGIYNNAKLELKLITPQNNILGSKSLMYVVTFPFQHTLPKMTQIVFNNVVLCQGPPFPLLPGRGVTNIWAAYQYKITIYTFPITPTNQAVDESVGNGFRPSVTNPFLTNLPKPEVVPVNIPQSTTTTTTSTTTTTTTTVAPQSVDDETNNVSDNTVCGLENSVQQLIIGGESTSPDQYPWVVAMMVAASKLRYQYKCTGSLISDRHVITAAQCVQYYSVRVVEPDDILLIMGTSNLSRWATSDAVKRSAVKITTHPEYTQYSGHGDLCVIEFAPPVKFTNKLRPICLWSQNNDLEPYVGQRGRVCGWGKTTKDAEGDMMGSYHTVTLPMVSQEECLRSNYAFQNITSEKTFCAGEKNESGPCIGDGGAGFMLKSKSDNLWYLRGLVSKTFKQGDTCNLNEYVVFCDVAKYSDWVKDIISSK
ncbi:serine protease gd [Aethina tumida]|uniref:serine protease gd n=1 Tax=Aethina tumida TaxID=116153 RepID=UPI00096B659D|nr:serine protease gd [Aethina tumida]XP_049824631.1 serine protease gd [Aethina tumida]